MPTEHTTEHNRIRHLHQFFASSSWERETLGDVDVAYSSVTQECRVRNAHIYYKNLKCVTLEFLYINYINIL